MIALFLDEVKPSYFYLAKEYIENRIYYFDKLNIAHKIFTDLDEYLLSDIETKIAILHNNFTHSPVTVNFLKKFPVIQQVSKLIFIVETENHCPEIQTYLNYVNVVLVLPSPLNNNALDDQVIFKPCWFEITLHIYKQLPNLLDSLDPYTVKPKFFDVLLGIGKPHRDVICDLLLENNLTDQNIISYYLRNSSDQTQNLAFIPVLGAVKVYNDNSHEVVGSNTQVRYLGETAHLACIILTEVYNQTAYSVVAETNPNNDFHLFSEKLVKPILGRRLFVVFAGRGYLDSLQKAGFQTFDGIIDESYDKEFDNLKRWHMAFDQIKFLCSQNQEFILPKIRDIVDHNYKLIMETDWAQLAIDQMINKVRNLTT